MSAPLRRAFARADGRLALAERTALLVLFAALLVIGLAGILGRHFGDSSWLAPILAVSAVAAGSLGVLRGRKRDGVLAAVLIVAVLGASRVESGLEPLARLAVLWLGCLGASLGARHGDHVNLALPWPERWRPALRPVVAIAAIVVLAPLTLYALSYMLDAEGVFVTLRPGDVEVSAAAARAALPAGTALLLWRFLLRLIGVEPPRDEEGAS